MYNIFDVINGDTDFPTFVVVHVLCVCHLYDFSWVDCTPCVLIDSGKYFATALTVSMGHDAKNFALIAFLLLYDDV